MEGEWFRGTIVHSLSCAIDMITFQQWENSFDEFESFKNFSPWKLPEQMHKKA